MLLPGTGILAEELPRTEHGPAGQGNLLPVYKNLSDMRQILHRKPHIPGNLRDFNIISKPPEDLWKELLRMLSPAAAA